MDKVAVLIPCYNEEKTIGKVISDFKMNLPEGSVIYVYDNNSTDATVCIAEQAGAIVRHEKHQGKGNVIRKMFREIDALCYIMVDGDDTYPAEYASKLIHQILVEDDDMVIADRLSSTYRKENKRPFHNLGNNLVRDMINLLFNYEIKDIMTGYRGFSYQFVKSFPVLSSGFEIETEMSIHAIDKKMAISSLVIEYRDRPEGSVSKLNTFSDGFKVLKTIGNLVKFYKPGFFFGILALFLVLISACFFIPVMMEYLKTGLVPNFPTLIMCGFVMIAAIQSLYSGLILETIQHKSRQDFELQLHAIRDRQLQLKNYL
jgi:glycosyltransferase involved in cell wall biosynthesis